MIITLTVFYTDHWFIILTNVKLTASVTRGDKREKYGSPHISCKINKNTGKNVACTDMDTYSDTDHAFQERKNKRSCATTVVRKRCGWNVVVPIEKILKEIQSRRRTDVRLPRDALVIARAREAAICDKRMHRRDDVGMYCILVCVYVRADSREGKRLLQRRQSMNSSRHLDNSFPSPSLRR